MNKPTNKGSNKGSKGMTVKVLTNEEVVAKAVNTPATTTNKPTMTAEEKQAAKQAAAEKHYEEQLKALLAMNIPQAQAEEILKALKPIKQAGTRSTGFEINAFQHALLKDVVKACKMYRNKDGEIVPETIKQGTKTVPNPEAVSYTIESFKTSDFNSLVDISAKIADIVSWFKPNASKTGKACTTADDQANQIINEMFKAVALNIGMACQPKVPGDKLPAIEVPAEVPAEDKAGN